MTSTPIPGWVSADLLERFQRYARIHTTSSHESTTVPSTERQWELARVLASDLRALGIDSVDVTEHAYVIARLEGRVPGAAPFALFAHIDTAPDFSGEAVEPRVHRDYAGGIIPLSGDRVLDPDVHPELRDFVGDTIITSDGTTLLGADDKAGVAEIVTFVRLLREEPIQHGPIEIVFNPDEEVGRGIARLPFDRLRSEAAYTVDGGREGSVEAECFSAVRVEVEIDGSSIHPGSARGKLVNATTLAARLISMLPQNESPEATDDRFGFYCPTHVTGGLGQARVVMILRDFEHDEVERRVAVVRSIAATLEATYPPSTIRVQATEQYRNMRDGIATRPFILDRLVQAITRAGLEPHLKPIRGGTDGALLTGAGIPTPNLFSGGFNFHGPFEWIPLGSMVRAVAVLRELALLWAAPA